MRKSRFLTLFLALLLLLFATACSKEPDTPPSTPPSGGQESPSSEGDEAPTDGPEAAPETDPEVFLSTNGYPMGISIVFEKDGAGFDTAANLLTNGSDSKSYTFTAEDYRDLYYRLGEGGFWELSEDLTYSHLTGASAPEGAGTQYTVTVTTEAHGTVTCRTDTAALEHYSSAEDSELRSEISRIKTIISYFGDCLEMYRNK